MKINKKWTDRHSFRRNTGIVNSTITNTQYKDTDDPNTAESNIETYLESNVNTPSNISQKSSPEFTIDISTSNRIIETSIPSDTRTHDTQPKWIFSKKRLNSKIVVFPVSITKFLSDIQNTEHENSRIEVLTKDITFLQNELKSKVTIIELSNYFKHRRFYEVLIPPNPQNLSINRKSKPTTTATASGPLSTPSPTPATTSAKPNTAHTCNSLEKTV